MKGEIKATARVQITVEVILTESWGDKCDIGQLHKQASESGVNALRNALLKSDFHCMVVGEPKVFGIITEREK